MTTLVHPQEPTRAEVPNDLAAFWLPFTPNRAFKKRPRLIARSKDMHYYTPEGARSSTPRRRSGAATPATTGSRSSTAIQRQAAELDFSPTFQFAHPQAFQLASRLAELAPGDLDHVFFTNSGSEAADTALKIAIAYHNVRGRWLAPAADRPRARLSRRRLRRHFGRRHGQQPQVLRLAARRRRPSAGHLQSRASGLHQGRAGVGRPSRRRARRHRRPA